VANGTEPIADDELLYRRVSAKAQPQRFDPATRQLSDQAFAPHKTEDATGLSVTRAKGKTIEQAARGGPGKSYYVAILRAGDLRQRGIAVEPRPTPDDPGHAELPQLNSASRKESRTLELQRELVSLCLAVEGPYETPAA
jgi:hypothetical protein